MATRKNKTPAFDGQSSASAVVDAEPGPMMMRDRVAALLSKKTL
jgi:hypothetical protein